MLYKGISASEFKAIFEETLGLIKNYLKTMSLRVWLDVHEMAHRAVEVHFRYPSVPLSTLVKKMLEEFSCQRGCDVIKQEHDTINEAEVALDLGRLYLMVEKYLSDEDKALFRRINLTDDAQVERLGQRMRKVLDATTSTKEFRFKTSVGGRGQKLSWQAFLTRRHPAVPNTAGDRRSRQRLGN